MHQLDRDTPWDEIWQAMDILVQQGKVIYVGSSNFAGWNIAQANEAARRRNFLGLVSEQCKYSLARRLVEMEVLPACQSYGLGVMPWAPLTGGLLGGVLGKITDGRRSGDLIQGLITEHRPQLEAYEALCAEAGENPAHVALTWLLANPVVTAPIIGPRTVEQLEDCLRATEITLSVETLRRLDEIFPGPGAPAPETWLDRY
jgi:aryl-alcohol dehydrogenase-like predicted oxidoreductase